MIPHVVLVTLDISHIVSCGPNTEAEPTSVVNNGNWSVYSRNTRRIKEDNIFCCYGVIVVALYHTFDLNDEELRAGFSNDSVLKLSMSINMTHITSVLHSLVIVEGVLQDVLEVNIVFRAHHLRVQLVYIKAVFILTVLASRSLSDRLVQHIVDVHPPLFILIQNDQCVPRALLPLHDLLISVSTGV